MFVLLFMLLSASEGCLAPCAGVQGMLSLEKNSTFMKYVLENGRLSLYEVLEMEDFLDIKLLEIVDFHYIKVLEN